MSRGDAKSDRRAARERRSAEALRANLKRRKVQERERSEAPDGSEEQTSATPPPRKGEEQW